MINLQFEEYVNLLKRKIKVDKNKILFVCIGTTNVVWDSIGPFVGNYLKSTIGTKYVLGDINNNICSKYDLIKHYSKIKNKYIVAIDSALTNKNLEGEIFVDNKPIILGLGINKNKGIVGDSSIKICSSKISDINYIIKVSQFIGKGICELKDKY